MAHAAQFVVARLDLPESREESAEQEESAMASGSPGHAILCMSISLGEMRCRGTISRLFSCTISDMC